jgi:glyoxylase-like metal-dependent hydrolase (beta-lactamase superfamily II)
MPFLTEPEPERGAALPVRPGVRRIVAANPGPMTYHGTNTYLIDRPEGVIVLDPGPDDPSHIEAIHRATGGRVALILLSHTHHDHVGAVAALKAITGAPVAGFVVSALDRFAPDTGLRDGDAIGGLVALHTPGHAADHLCFAMTAQEGEAILFSADHVMSWSSSVVSPPNGNMMAYFASLERLLQRKDDLFLPGHGPPLPEPRLLVRDLLEHRRAREHTIADALAAGPADTRVLMETAYSVAHPTLRRAAERNVLAHLLKLEAEGRVVRDGEIWRKA